MTTVGQNIKKYRTKLGMSQVGFAKAIGVSKQTLYKYENDIITNIPSDKIELAAHVCDVSPAVLMGWDDVEDSEQQPQYYVNAETAALAQKLLTDPHYRILFDAAEDSKPEDLQMVADLLRRLKEERT